MSLQNSQFTAVFTVPKVNTVTFQSFTTGKIITVEELIALKEKYDELLRRVAQLECQVPFGPYFVKDLEEERGLVPNIDVLFVKK